MLQLLCSGNPRIKLSSESTPNPLTPKAMALLVYLAVTQRAHSRDVLADLLWSETNHQQARDNLRYLLPELRRPLGDYLLITTQSIAFNQQAPYWLDVEVLRTTLTRQMAAVATPALQAALQLYQGEFLAGFTVRNAPVFEAWVVRQREELHTLAVQGSYTLAQRYWQQADYRNGLTATQQLLHWEPWHEGGHRLQMQLLAYNGQRTAALAQYDLCRTILADELGVAPEAATTELYEQIRRGTYEKEIGRQGDKTTRQQAHVLPAMPRNKVTSDKVTSTSSVTLSPCHNLPMLLTSFLGRTQEVAEIVAQLQEPHPRLITLVGEGGVGKTRLALTVAQAILDSRFLTFDSSTVASSENQKSKVKNQNYQDGVWFIPLTGLAATDTLPEQVAVAVGNALGVSFSGQRPALAQLLPYLYTKRLLLLFDNAEHLLPGIADVLRQLLESCRQLTILVTARQLLNLQAESVRMVAGLPIPPPASKPSAGDVTLATYSSVALFIERAKQRNRHFQLTPANQTAVATICRLVEGSPLAIELAAALTSHYACAEIAAALQRDFTILATTLADLPPRQRSIQATLDYSWRFLTPAAAHTLAACAIFAGGFTRQAAAAAADADTAALNMLVDHSLLQLRDGRFTLHELVRQYAAAKLAQNPAEQHAIAARHATYYIQQLATLATELVVDPDAQTRFQNELGNLRLAWRWSVGQGNLALLDQGAAGLECGYLLLGLYGEAIQLLEAALGPVRQNVATAPAHQQNNTLLARLLCHTAHFYRRSGQLASGERLANEASALAECLADPALQALAYHEWARVVQQRGDFITACTLAEQACAQARLAQAPHLLAECLNDLGVVRGASGNPLTAIPHFHEGLHYLQGGINRRLEQNLLGNLGIYYLAGRQYQAAYEALQRALALKRLFSYPESEAITLLQIGDLWLAVGQYEQAQQSYDQVLSIVETVCVPQWESWLHASLARLHYLRGDLAAARQACVTGSQITQSSQQHLQEQWMLINWGHLLTDLGDYTAARNRYEQAIAMPRQVNWVYRTADAHAGLAALLLATNEVAAAVAQIEAALALLTQLGLAGANEPFTVYWTAVRVFRAANDARATATLYTAYQALQKVAAQFTDESWRRSFLGAVLVNRHLLGAAQAAGMG